MAGTSGSTRWRCEPDCGKLEAMDSRLLDILACPICKGPLMHRREQCELVCRGDRLAWPIREGVPNLLVAAAREITPQELQEMEPRK